MIEGMTSIDRALERLHAAQADLDRLAAAMTVARRQRREAAEALVAEGLGPTWIGRQLGISPQAVQSFLSSVRR